MSLPEIEVAKYLRNDQKLMSEMDKLRQAQLSYPPVFTGTPDDSFIKTSSAPWIRVTTIPGDNATFSDDARLFEFPRVQVDFWIRKEKMGSIEKLQQRIYDTLHSHDYERYYQNRYADPDLDDCLMVTANFEGFRTEGE